MHRFFLISLAGAMLLTACNDIKKPSDGNFRKAINQYLEKHGKACTWIGRPFPVDVSEPEQRLQFGTSAQMAVLEAAGLVHSSDTIGATLGIFGPGAPRRVKRYEPTEAGNKYLQQVPGVLGQSAGFCYGNKTVDSIVKWTEPVTMGPYSQTEVTYTYKIVTRKLGGTPGRSARVLGYSNDGSGCLEDDSDRGIAVDQQGLGSSGIVSCLQHGKRISRPRQQDFSPRQSPSGCAMRFI